MLATGCGVTNEGESSQEVLREGRVACAIGGGRAVYDWLTRGGVDGRCVNDVNPRIGWIARLEAMRTGELRRTEDRERSARPGAAAGGPALTGAGCSDRGRCSTRSQREQNRM